MGVIMGCAFEGEPAIDEELLEEARRHLGMATRNEAINAALHELVMQQRTRRRAGLDALRRMADEGVFNFAALGDVDR
jgi:Arc/MetJ family transcription regulator